MKEQSLRKQHKQLDLFQAMLAHGIEAVAQRDHPADEKMYEEQLQRAALSDPVGRELRKGAARRPSHTGAFLTVEERVAIAGIFVRHAMTRTELGRVSWASARARTLYRLANARWYGVARHLAFVLLCAVVVIEPVRTLDGPPPGPYWAAATAAELACCAFFVADIGVLIGYQGRKEFFDLRSSVWRRRWDRWARLVLVALLCADALVALAITLAAGWVPFRPSRVLRERSEKRICITGSSASGSAAARFSISTRSSTRSEAARSRRDRISRAFRALSPLAAPPRAPPSGAAWRR